MLPASSSELSLLLFPSPRSTLLLHKCGDETCFRSRASSLQTIRGRTPVEERIRFITHKGQRILLVDVSNCSADEVSSAARLVPSYTTPEPRGSLLLLADFSGAKFDKATLTALKESTAYSQPHLKRSAWVGVESLPKVFYENIRNFSRRELPTFSSRDEALDYLVMEEPASAAS